MKEILKSDGTEEVFAIEKLEASLIRAGAGSHTARKISKTIEQTIVPSIGTNEIFRRAHGMLRRISRPLAARYALRRALFELGPSGHPFEDFIAELFASEGWAIERRKMIAGKCVDHEVDVYAVRENEHLAAELKYHNTPTMKTDIKVALYVKARFDDIWQCDTKRKTCTVDRGFLITNTKFTTTAINYAQCAGIELIGWSFPYEGNLYDRILASGVYPITALTTLQKKDKRVLLDRGVVSTNQLFTQREVLRQLNISPQRIGAIIAEIVSLKEERVVM